MVDPRSHIGAHYRKAMQGNPGHEKYEKMTRPEAARFRLDWAKKEFTKFKDSKMATKTWRRVDTQKGDYLNMDQLVHDQGGWQSSRAVQGSVKLIRKCVAMGPPWLKKHPQTERLMFLRLISSLWRNSTSRGRTSRKSSATGSSVGTMVLMTVLLWSGRRRVKR